MISLELFDTPQIFFQSLADPEYNMDYVRSEVVTNLPIGIWEITFDLSNKQFSRASESLQSKKQKLRERGIVIDEGKEINFGAVEQEQEQETEEEETEEEETEEEETEEEETEEEEYEELKVTMEMEVEEVEVQKKERSFTLQREHQRPSHQNHSSFSYTAVFPIAEGEQYECDVLMTGELKKKYTPDTVDDNKKSNATHIMGANPTRPFMFGLTIDKFNVRLWTKTPIYFALSLSRACLEELGYDPTVRRVQGKDGTGPRNILTIDSQQYITTEAITVRKAKCLLGCAARVFKVQQVLNYEGDFDSKVKVIKDYWLPEDSDTELEIRLAIEANVQKVNAVPNLDRSARYFVRIEACEKISVPSTTEKGQTPDTTSNFLRGQTLPSRKDFIDGNMNMGNLAVASTLPNFYFDWACAAHFAGVVKNKYYCQRAFIRCATEGWTGAVTHRGRPKQPAEDDPEKKTKKSKVT
ncbi:hypothetical protein F5876DRAFT_67780 [Lentinula aff. lateritia]|uniref:Uncharacterized protein n=1 Tax=Lentinula aff. lateritia TaxID=2804960 RepID=A0ACC1TTD8_9AGAR|nr:hypothetical protein F5876DRAFT_67780 [Lentinula aff. lateritia]